MVAETTELDPYVGPRPFQRTEADQARFFGRDRETDEIVSLIVSHPVVLIYAQSGAGKTSLFEAKVVPTLSERGFQVFPLARVRAAIPEGLDPASIQNLYVFASLLSLESEEEPREEAEKSLAAKSLDESLKARAADTPAPRCIVFDQFEEIITDESVFALRPTRWQEEQEAFFREIAKAVNNDSLLRAVFVVRKEHLAELDRFAALMPEGFRTRFHLEPLGRQAALSAVERPVRNTKRSFADGVAEELVEKLLTMRVDVGGEIKEVRGRFVEPLHLQLVCRRIWEELGPDDTVITKEHLRTLGDVDQVLGALYDKAVEAASVAGRMSEKRLRRRIDSDFITPAGTRGIVFVGETPDGAGFRQAVTELDRQRLIRAEWHAGVDWYELTHDRLIEPIRASNARYRQARARRLRRWLAAGVAIAAIAGGIAAGVVLTETPDEPSQGLFRLKEIATLPGSGQPGPEYLSSAAFSPDGKFVVTAGDDGDARVWDWRVKTLKAVLKQSAPLSRAAFSPDGELVVTADADGAARIWGWTSRDEPAVLRQPGSLSDAAFSPNGRFVVTASTDGAARVWDGEKIVAVLRQPAPLSSSAFSPDGNFVVTAGDDGAARVWDLGTRKVAAVLVAPQRAGQEPAQLLDAAFSPDGKLVVTAGGDGEARVWDWERAKSRAALPGQTQVTSAAFSADGEFVLTASADGVARIWGWRSKDAPAPLPSRPDPLTSAAWSPRGVAVVTADQRGFARIYRPAQVPG
jgi:WD40 repeat protein